MLQINAQKYTYTKTYTRGRRAVPQQVNVPLAVAAAVIGSMGIRRRAEQSLEEKTSERKGLPSHCGGASVRDTTRDFQPASKVT